MIEYNRLIQELNEHSRSSLSFNKQRLPVRFLATLFFLVSLISGISGQNGNFIGQFDYPEVHLSLAVPTGQFANDTYTPTSQQAGYAENGFAAGLSYHIGFGESILGWQLNLSYRQMANKRFNDIDQLNPPLRPQDETGVLTKQGHYTFVSFLNGPMIQLNTRIIDPYIQGFFGPSYISGSETRVTGTSGNEYVYSINGTVGLGRGGEIGLVFADNFRIGLSYITYGTLQLNIQEGSDFFNSRSSSLRQPVAFWQFGISYIWKKS